VEQNARAALQVADYAYVLEMGEIVAKARPQPWRPIRASSRAIWAWPATEPACRHHQRRPRVSSKEMRGWSASSAGLAPA
jgi:hypothetical protein